MTGRTVLATRPATAGAARPLRSRWGVGSRLGLAGVTLLGALIIAAGLGVAVGTADLSLGEVIQIIAGRLGLGPADLASPRDTVVVLQVRLPRVVVAALVGAALGVSGAALQGVFRNPLAEPGVVGVSAGGALGAVIALYFGLTSINRWILPGLAFLGSAAAIAVVLGVAALNARRLVSSLLLVGIAINALLGAVISMMVATADTDDDLRSIVFWLQGGLEARTWDHVGLIIVPVGLGLVAIMTFGRDLNVLGLGDEQARASGVDVTRIRLVILLLAALITGASVAVSGTIAFVGVVVPHAIRLIAGPDHRVLLPASALGGATFLIMADLIARTVFAPVVLQVGVITALVGAPVLLWFVTRSTKERLG